MAESGGQDPKVDGDMPKFDRLVEISKALDKPVPTRQNHIAFIIKNGKIVSIGTNKAKTHPKSNCSPYESEGWNQLHAEVDAIIKYGRIDCTGHTIVVIRVRPSGKLGMSKPCVGCMHLLKQLNFKKIFYSTNDQEFLETQQERDQDEGY
jgi:deoxycytidylate deaminase